ncbi:hypothetical protein AA313_de0207200 [Arthrobotrys entomopaga]|nr:hypothetical protein AA313_de0207200 [Arthrobotrys entomopaga]
MSVGWSLTPEVAFAMRPMTVFPPVNTTIPVAEPLVTRVPVRAIFRVSRKLESVMWTAPSTSSASPVSIDRSKRMSPEVVRRRISAGTLLPIAILTMSPTTRSLEGTLLKAPSRKTKASDGRRSNIDSIVFFVDQSWNAEKHACKNITMRTKIESPRLYAWGLGSPSGLQQIKKMMTPIHRTEQKPPKTYPSSFLV